MRTLAILLALAVPLAARAEDGIRPSAGVFPSYLTRAADPLLLCDSAVAEDCFRLLAARLDRRALTTIDKACAPLPDRALRPTCNERDR